MAVSSLHTAPGIKDCDRLLPQCKVSARSLHRPRLPAQILALLIHAQQAQRLGLGQAVGWMTSMSRRTCKTVISRRRAGLTGPLSKSILRT